MPAAAHAQAPTGLLYRPDLIDPDEEVELADYVRDLDFREVSVRGQTARRRVRLYGYDDDYETGQVQPGDPLPPELAWLRDRCAELAGTAARSSSRRSCRGIPPERASAGIATRRCSAPR